MHGFPLSYKSTLQPRIITYQTNIKSKEILKIKGLTYFKKLLNTNYTGILNELYDYN